MGGPVERHQDISAQSLDTRWGLVEKILRNTLLVEVIWEGGGKYQDRTPLKDAEVAPLYKDCKCLDRGIKSCLKYSGLPGGTGGKKKKNLPAMQETQV